MNLKKVFLLLAVIVVVVGCEDGSELTEGLQQVEDWALDVTAPKDQHLDMDLANEHFAKIEEFLIDIDQDYGYSLDNFASIATAWEYVYLTDKSDEYVLVQELDRYTNFRFEEFPKVFGAYLETLQEVVKIYKNSGTIYQMKETSSIVDYAADLIDSDLVIFISQKSEGTWNSFGQDGWQYIDISINIKDDTSIEGVMSVELFDGRESVSKSFTLTPNQCYFMIASCVPIRGRGLHAFIVL